MIAAEVTGSSLVSAFNGLLLAIPALTGLVALAALGELARAADRGRVDQRPAYLAASFLAQSAFKETAMALFVLAFAIALAGLPEPGGGLSASSGWSSPRRACSPSAFPVSPGSPSRCRSGSRSKRSGAAGRSTAALPPRRSWRTGSRSASGPWSRSGSR